MNMSEFKQNISWSLFNPTNNSKLPLIEIKADICLDVATFMFRDFAYGPETDLLIEKTAAELMHLSMESLKRIKANFSSEKEWLNSVKRLDQKNRYQILKGQ